MSLEWHASVSRERDAAVENLVAGKDVGRIRSWPSIVTLGFVGHWRSSLQHRGCVLQSS